MPFAIIPSEEISHRSDFAHLCNARGYTDAVEVGVDLGVNARDFLSRFEGHWLLCVDAYAPHAGYDNDRTADMLTAVQALMPWHGKFRFFRGRSVDVAAHYPVWLKSPDFVYVDAGHLYDDAKADLEAWWARMAPTGCLGGHDWDDAHPGVVRAVTEFAQARGLVVRLTAETDTPRSWYVYKGGEPERLWVGGEWVGNPHAAGEG